MSLSRIQTTLLSGDISDSVLRSLLVPPAPTDLTVTGGNEQVLLSWVAPTVLAQTPITDYTVQFSTNSGSTWTTFSDGTSTATSATVTGLTNGTGYVFRVAAVNGVGTGAYSSATSSVTPGDVFRAIPTMTSLTSPSGEVSGVNNIESPTFQPRWMAFDGDSSTWAQFQRAGFNNPARTLQYAFPEGQKSRATGYMLRVAFPGYGEPPNQWKFFGSDNLTDWTLLDSRSGQSFSSGSPSSNFTLASPANYTAYRWVFQDVSDLGDSILIATVQLLE